MDLLEKLLLVVHLVGMAALLGGALVQVRAVSRSITTGMVHGILTQLVSGLLLVGVLEGQNEPVNNAKMAVKLGVALVIAVLCLANRRKEAVPTGLFFGVLGLTLLNVVIAVFW